MERFLEYWQACKQQEILHSVTPLQLLGYCHTISGEDCLNGQITNSAVLSKLSTNQIGVIPKFGNKDNDYFIPCILLVNLEANGTFSPIKHLSLPIVPYAVLEPAHLASITLGDCERINEYVAMNIPEWLDEEDISWDVQLEYANNMLDSFNWQNDLTELGYLISNNAMVFSVDAIAKNNNCFQELNLDIFEDLNSIKICDAPKGSNSTGYIQEYIEQAWVMAALKNSEPPRYVWLKPKHSVKYATLLGEEISLNPYPELTAEYDSYLQGKQCIRNLQEIKQRLLDKYQDRGGIYNRLLQLKQTQRDYKAQLRHLEVLLSIWEKQKDLLTKWSKIFDFVPLLQKNRLSRLYTFFAENFPNDNVLGLTQAECEELLKDKEKRLQTSLRVLEDALHQVETDISQQEIIQNKCISWLQNLQVNEADVENLSSILELQWQKIVALTACYWQQDFAAKNFYNNFCDMQPDSIDLLLVENAQNISPMQAIVWMSKAKHAVILGNYTSVQTPRFANYIDYELTKYYALVENDADFEDLQFDGILGSNGNLWNMVTKGLEADNILDVVETNISYEFIDVKTQSKAYHGSLVNHGSCDATIGFLTNNQQLWPDINIYTCFSAQVLFLQQQLANIGASIAIYLLQEPVYNQAKINIFIPVNTAQDRGPYIFDKGAEMFAQLMANTKERLIVIGDRDLFKPHLHSASGNFAKNFFKNSINNKITIDEVDCVAV